MPVRELGQDEAALLCVTLSNAGTSALKITGVTIKGNFTIQGKVELSGGVFKAQEMHAALRVAGGEDVPVHRGDALHE